MKKTIFTLSLIVSAYIPKAQVWYGTTYQGGNNDGGTICKLVAATNSLTAQFSFDAPGINNTGDHMIGALIKGLENKLFGMTSAGGRYGAGTIFSYGANTDVFTKLKDFNWINGASPSGNLILASDGKLYGATDLGGENSNGAGGVIFSYDPATSIYTKLVDTF